MIDRAADAWRMRFLRLAEHYRTTFGSPTGQETLRDLLRFTGVSRPSFVPDDPTLTAYNEGLRCVGLRLMRVMNLDAAQAFQLTQGTTDDGRDDTSR